MLELADRAGFYAYHLAEHHATELSTVPSPNVFLSAVAPAHARLRIGSLSYILPLYSPMRLLEEVCMLDQLSGGRLEFGLSRGSFGEHIDTDPDKARAMFNEELQVMLMGISTGEIDFHGQLFDSATRSPVFEPVQTPYPPLWYPTSNLDSVPWIAANGINAVFSVHLAPRLRRIEAMVKRYWSELEAHRGDADRLNGHVDDPKSGFIGPHARCGDRRAGPRAGAASVRDVHPQLHVSLRPRGATRTLRPSAATSIRSWSAARSWSARPRRSRAQTRGVLKRSGANYVSGCFLSAA